MSGSVRSFGGRRAGRGATRRPASSGGRPWLVPLAATLLMLAVVAGAVLASSVTRGQVSLDDGTVWVTSLADGKAARFNVRLREADAAVSASANRFDVAQSGPDTMLDEGVSSSSIKASTAAVDATAETGGNVSTMFGGGTAVMFDASTGDVWIADADDAASISPESDQPAMRLGRSGKAVVDAEGTVWGYRVRDGMVLTVRPHGGKAEEWGSLSDGERLAADSFTVVDGVPAVSSAGVVRYSGGEARFEGVDRLALQAPSVDGVQSGWLAAASRTGLHLVDVAHPSRDPVTLASGGKGEAAVPVSSGGCVYGAWSRKAANYVRVCSVDDDADFSSLSSVDATSQLVFRVNHRQVVLNDVVDGGVWDPRSSTEMIRIQWNRVDTDRAEGERSGEESADNGQEFAKECSAQSGRIEARDDEFGARVGVGEILDVLRNDRQTDCSVLRISEVAAPDGADIRVSPIYDGRYLQLDAAGASAGTASFTYEITDGHGQSSTATVRLTLADSGNAAPEQSDVPAEHEVEQGASVTVNALGGFTDPDGDPITLTSATALDSDEVTVSTRADGRLTFNAGSLSSGRVGVRVTVSDGELSGDGMVYFSVKAANTLPADLDPVSASAVPGEETSIDLSDAVHATGAQGATLSSVDAPDNASVTMDAADMTLRFRASDPGTYYVPYTVTQGSVPAVGLARVEVAARSGEATRPVVANDVALLDSSGSAIVEPLSNDVDPLGGVLSVTSVSADPDSGVKAGLVGHRRVYLTARCIPVAPVVITYTAANAAGEATGTIVLQPPSLSAGTAGPKADDVQVSVRAGGIVSVDVLDHVTAADGASVTLDDEVRVDEDSFEGLAFVSGDTVRYQASERTGSYPIIYTVHDSMGNAASGTITVAVHEADAEHKAAPTPKSVEAQVAAGGKVRISVPLTGIDRDGDDVLLLGLGNQAPKLGRVTETGADYLVYEAYADSSGTDEFTYAVEDWTGQRAQARVRVGVFQGSSGSGVVARDDEVTLRPGVAATVPVTLNDVSGDNEDLTVDDALEAQGVEDARADGGVVEFTAPEDAGVYYVSYTAKDKAGLSDTATLTVNVDPEAAVEPPTAYDYRVPASATVDRKSVDVDVSPWIANPSGSLSDLTVDVHPSASAHARRKGGADSTVITVDLTDEARSVPYTVTNTAHGISTTAFIQVPAYGVFPPTLRPKAPELRVDAGDSIRIDIADYVRVGAGKTAYVDGKDSVSATKAADGDLYVDETTLRFTAPKDYAGPASITFTAVDSRPGGGGAKIVNSAVITLPVTVVGRNAPAPTFSSSTIDVEAGANAKTIDLTALTHTPEGVDAADRRYTYSGGLSSGGVEATVSERGMLTVTAVKDADPGATLAVPVSIAYDGGVVEAGVTVRVTASTRPLARIADASLRVEAGGEGSVDVLENAYNPFPDEPLRVVRCVSDDSSKLTVSCDDSGVVSVKAARDIGASANRVLVTVRDATGSEDRQVTGTLTVSVVDRPEAPLLSPMDAQSRDGAVALSWTPGAANGSPVVEYEVLWSGGADGSRSCGAVTSCVIDGLTNGREYSFQVRARNEVGWSDSSNAVTGTPDKVPSAPAQVEVSAERNAVRVSWRMPDGDGSPADRYTVSLSNGMSETVSSGTSHTFRLQDKDITDGLSVTASVSAHNRAGDGPAATSAGSARPWGTPDAPVVSARQEGDEGGSATVSVALGDMRNTVCRSVTVTLGSLTQETSCAAPSASFTISSDLFGTPLTPKATVHTDHGDAAGEGAALTPTYTPHTPEGLAVSGTSSGDCLVTWKAASGHADAYLVGVNGGAETRVRGTSLTYDPGAWRACGTVTARTVFGDASSGSVTASSQDMPNRPKAVIGDYAFSWADHDTLRIDRGSVETYGRPATVALTLKDAEGHTSERELRWSADAQQAELDLGADAALSGKVTWTLTLTDGDAALVEGVERSGEVSNDRPVARDSAYTLSPRATAAAFPSVSVSSPSSLISAIARSNP